MKITAKVFIIIGIVLHSLIAIFCLISMFWLSSSFIGMLFWASLFVAGAGDMTMYLLAFLILNITGIVVGAITLHKLNTAIERKGLTGIGVCCLIFCNLVAGILILCLKNKHFLSSYQRNSNQCNCLSNSYELQNYSTVSNFNNMVEKLKQWKTLKENGIITEEEYNKIKTELINKL